jgi:methyltransferase (TIGR00027 family)
VRADRASATARLIAAATVMREGAEDGPPAGAGAWCARFLSTSVPDRLLLASARSRIGRAWWGWIESATIPGIVSHWMCRKRVIDHLVREAIDDGYSQLIVLGAGLDSLAWRLAGERTHERIISADHPATLSVVRSALARRLDSTSGESSGTEDCVERVELLALDIDIDDAICVLTTSRTFDSTRATIVVVEGVLMYLAEPGVERVLRALASLPSASTRLVASWMLDQPGRPIGFEGQGRPVAAWLRRRQEPMRWATTPASLLSFLARCGWREPRIINLGEDDLPGNTPAHGLRGEQLFVSERSE